MNYNLIKSVLELIQQYEAENSTKVGFEYSVDDFKKWITLNYKSEVKTNEPVWEGKENGRSSESVINTLIVHMNRYAKSYSKAAIFGSDFSTQEDFIFLINLKAFGEMTKMDLIKKNIQEKSVGMQIINRLINKKWVDQKDSETDKRSKLISISTQGLETLGKQMNKIRQATNIVTGNLTHYDKMELIRLLNKLNDFHHPIYCKNLEPAELLGKVLNKNN